MKKLLPILALLAFACMEVYPQEKEYIKYILSISSGQGHTNPGLINKLGSILFGGAKTEIRNPVDVYAEDPGKVWILSQGNCSLLINSNGGLSECNALFKANKNFPSLVGICRVGEKMLFTDSYENGIYELSADCRSYKAFAPEIDFSRPTGIAYLIEKDEVWVVETAEHRINVLDGKGRHLKYLGRRGSDRSEFNFPTHIWIDRDGKVYIVDSMNFRVQVFNSKGEFLNSFGKAGDASGYMARPKGIATDSYGNIYVADALFHTVQIFDSEGKFLYSFGGQGKGEGQFWMPNGIYIDENNYIYVSDNYNNRIQIFRLIK